MARPLSRPIRPDPHPRPGAASRTAPCSAQAGAGPAAGSSAEGPPRRPAAKATAPLSMTALASQVALVLATGLGLAAPVRAELVPFTGQGNLSVFDAAAGTGGWVGEVNGFMDPMTAAPWPAVVVVTFTLDPGTLLLSGDFSLTRSDDLSSVLTGSVSGSASSADVLTVGGQLSLDYLIAAGEGSWLGLTGFGLSFLDYMPAASPDNYTESGLFVTAVPEPGFMWLLALAAAGLALQSGRARMRAGAAGTILGCLKPTPRPALPGP